MNNKQHGRTFADLIHENKIVVILFLFMLLGIGIYVVVNGMYIKYGDLEINGKDTIKIAPTNKIAVPEVNLSPAKDKTTVLKSVKDSRQTNINNGVNNGVIGNNNDVTLGEKPIELSQKNEKLIILKLNEIIKENNLNDTAIILVTSTLSDDKSAKVAQLIKTFLKNKNYNVADTMGQSMYPHTPPEGYMVFYANGSITIAVGSIYTSEFSLL